MPLIFLLVPLLAKLLKFFTFTLHFAQPGTSLQKILQRLSSISSFKTLNWSLFWSTSSFVNSCPLIMTVLSISRFIKEPEKCIKNKPEKLSASKWETRVQKMQQLRSRVISNIKVYLAITHNLNPSPLALAQIHFNYH